ncbi:trypsin-like cysteine/serine peptidase domain-containing protein [Gamsiella multidivaricata]|uniref:trypsin-like cysteine/serine peptidase domain-containing protein n=1 Tax=Gamsiella multidivaricata TaxID=101098 RepID=UPI002220CF2A|nr:trypsin-like cysteine/serine peptidase domain-containing protein [Gamsiella multidivaricata]KAI7823553.1 trypsin-like cysteine/serine peptidase domain-containing protein [Gamsiella multidivaricata]
MALNNLAMTNIGGIPQPLGVASDTPKLTTQTWESTLERSIRSIVSITANHVRSFDTETSGAYSATGFLVDAKRGIILTNRHVVSPAPILALAILSNYEEVELKPIYRDPVHDFGFMQFDTSKVRFMRLEEIPLSPERARVGLEIRVVGNDAGEKLSILAGTLARLDRQAPEYGQGEYNDFNTFYLQAASSTSGGSSGSPVLDIEGHAVALNAGGASKASSSYYLPLDRVKRALKFIQAGEQVPRGTLQTDFEYFPYDELRRLGLKISMEKQIRQHFPNETGMLIIKSVLPKGPAADQLIPGDIVIQCNGELIANFIQLFMVIDDSVGEKIALTVIRGSNSKLLTFTLTVQDLHSITPDRFVEVGGGVVNELSYQLAHSYGQPCGGVYVATSGHMLASASAWRKSIIVAVNNIPTPNLDAFIHAISTLPDGARVPIRFYTLQKAFKEKIMIMHVDRHWHRCRVGVRNDKTGIWDFTDLPPPPPSQPYAPATAIYPRINPSLHPAPVLMPSFVAVDFHLPFLVDGMKATQFYGTGLVVSTNPPLVVCDRDTIPISIGDIFITFANSVIIPGRLVYLHPHYNFVVLTYDSELLADTPVKPATFSDKPLMQGDECYLVGVGTDQSPVIKKTTVSNVGNIGTRECSPPRWRAMNVEGIKIDDPVGTQGGVLCDNEGKVQALWVNYSSQDEKGNDITFMSGLDVAGVKTVIEPFMRGEYPKLRALDVEFWTMRIAAARSLGLTDRWVQRIESDPNSKHQLLYVLSLLDTTNPCSQMLKVGDIVLELEGKVATSMKDLDRAREVEFVQMTVLREGKELQLKVPTVPLLGTDTNRIIQWAGALIQMPYKAVLEQVSNVPTGVYVSCTLYGSPASTALRPGVWITEVDGIPVANLDEFLDAVHRHENKVVRSRQGSVCEVGLKRLSWGQNPLLGNTRRLSAMVSHMLAHPEGLALQALEGLHPCDDSATPAPASVPTPAPAPALALPSAPTLAPGPGLGIATMQLSPTDFRAPTGAFSEGYEVTEEPVSPINADDAAQSQGYVRIKIQARNGTVSVIAMKLDPIYWSTTQLLPDPESVSGWKMVDVL